MQMQVEGSRLEVHFHEDGNCYGVVKPKSFLRRLMEENSQWPTSHLIKCRDEIQRMGQETPCLSSTASSFVGMINAIIDGRKRESVQ